MHSPAVAIAWQLWRQNRWIPIAIAAYFLAALAFCHLTPEAPLLITIRWFVSLPLLATPLAVVGVFLLDPQADLAGKESGYPRWMFTLPIKAHTLVGWPMLYGTLTMAATWVAVAWLIVKPCGLVLPLWQPALGLAAAMAWIQAICWSPFGLPLMRAGVGILAVVAVAAVPGVGWLCGAPESLILTLLAGHVPLAYAAAVAGISRGRRGDNPDWPWLPRQLARIAAWLPRRHGAFVSAARAQLWFEWRRNGLGIPAMVALALPAGVAMVLAHRQISNSPLGFPALLLILPVMMAIAAGPGLGGNYGCSTSARSTLALPSFLATRPLSTVNLIVAKLKVAAIGVLLASALTCTAVALLTVFCGGHGRIVERWSPLIERLGPVEIAVGVVLAAVGYLAMIWKLLVDNLCFGLTGRNWVVVAVIVPMLPMFLGSILLAHWVIEHPIYFDVLRALLPCLLGVAAIAKLLLAVYVLRVLQRRRLLSGPAMARLLRAWLACSVAVLAALYWFVPAGLLPWNLAVPGTVLVVPLLRVSLAPLALAWNRHR